MDPYRDIDLENAAVIVAGRVTEVRGLFIAGPPKARRGYGQCRWRS
jgi:hypothetical protein